MITQEEATHKPNTGTLTVISKMVCTGFSTPEKKLFILFWYYILVLMVYLTYVMVELETSDSVAEQLRNYFSCSIGGYKPECEGHKEKIESTSWRSYWLDLTSVLMLSSITISNLMYVLQIYTIKKVLSKLFQNKLKQTNVSNGTQLTQY